MKYLVRLILSAFTYLLFMPLALSAEDVHPLTGNDGPYIIYGSDTNVKSIRVSDGSVEVSEQASQKPFRVVSDNGSHSFVVTPHTISRPTWRYDMPQEVVVISDPHGDMDAFVSILRAAGVIDADYGWAFGQGHLMIIGDVFDRGNDVLPIFWLIYKLEAEADTLGGKVHFLLGNHETMVLGGDIRYITDKYHALARELGIKYNELWGTDTELGRWLATRNTMEQIGNNLFVHAGLSREFAEYEWFIPLLNEKIGALLHASKQERKDDTSGSFLFGTMGPIWYRGMVLEKEKYHPAAREDVDKILAQYGVGRIYVGHTIFDDVSLFFNDRVVAVNVANKKNMVAGHSRGILLSGDKVYFIFDDPLRREDAGL